MPEINRQAIVARIMEIAEQVGAPQGIEIVDVQLLGGGKARLLRIFIDRPEGVSHSDCELISHQVGSILDAGDVIPGAGYTLEVSSPGVERKLSKPGDFARFTGQKAKITLREPVESQRYWEGTLAGCDGGIISLQPSGDRVIQFPVEQVEKANLKFEW